MKDFNKGGRSFGGGNDRPRNSFGGGDRGGRSFGGDRGGSRGGGRDFDRPNPQMHSAICSECGNKCEVPFRPTGDKPVFCNNCFASKRDGDTRSFDKPRHEDRGDRSHGFDQKPAFSKPAGDDKRIDELKRQVDMINTKLDSLIKMVANNPFPTKVPVKSESLKSMVEKTQAPATAKPKAKSVEKPLAKPVVKTIAKKAPVKTVAKPVKKVVAKKKK